MFNARFNARFNTLVRSVSLVVVSASLIPGLAGCGWNRDDSQKQRDEKTREEVARETQRLKPAIQQAGRELGEAAKEAGEDANAAAQGVKEGWEKGSHPLLDVNSASERELTELPGITARDARKIIDGRPYRSTKDLVTNRVLPRSSYEKIEDQITVK